MLLDVVLLLVGGGVLYIGAEWLVKGSAGLAHAFGVKPLIIGLTVVAYGTSAPELAVSSAAILDGSSPMVLGNVIGSCIANIGLILGLTSLILPPAVDGQLIRREIPILCISALTVPVVLIGGVISRVEAVLLLSAALGFTLYTLFISATRSGPSQPANTANDGSVGSPAQDDGEAGQEKPQEEPSKLYLIAITAVGLVFLVGGGESFVSGAQGIARALGLSERFIGLTVVALGTSLPELAASLVAAARGFSSLAVGNVVGSNIFNIFLILGVVGNIRPIHGSLSSLVVDIGFLLGTTLLAVLFMRGSRRISRVEGVLLTATYVAFIVKLMLGW